MKNKFIQTVKENKQILLLVSSFLLMIFLISFTSADVVFSQQKLLLGNGTIKDNIFLTYSTPVNINGSIQSNDYVSGGKDFEMYYLYDINVKTWDNANPSFNISYCELKVNLLKLGLSNATTLFDANYTSNDEDIPSGKYFVKLSNGDATEGSITCYYTNTSYDFSNGLYYAGDIQAVQPTWECKSCQFYEWSITERAIVKAQVIGSNVSVVVGYIGNLIGLNFKIFLMLFWVALILGIFVGLSFIFYVAFYFFIFLKGVTK